MIHGIVTSDWHLGSLRRFFPSDHIQRQMQEIERIYEYAVEQGIKYIFVAGDISDTSTMDQEAYIALLLMLKKYDAVVSTYYLCGNHDFNDISKTSMDLLHLLAHEGMFKNLHVYRDSEQIELEDIVVNFLPYPHTESIPHKRRPCLNFSHVEYVGALGDNGRKMRSGNCFDMPEHDYNFSGHIHKHQILKDRRATYCGAPYQKTFGEGLPKGFVEFKAKETGGKGSSIKIKQKFVNLRPSFSLVNRVITTEADFGLLENDRNTLYSLALADGVNVPNDLRYLYPNIHAIFDKSSKEKLNKVAKAIRKGEAMPMSELEGATTNLSGKLKGLGYKKENRKYALNMVKEACAELAIQA